MSEADIPDAGPAPRPARKRNAMDFFIDTIELIAAFFVGIVAADIFISVMLRYFFSYQIPDAYDFGRLLLGILVFWGIAAPACPTTTRDFLIASARTTSLLGRLSNFARVSASMPRKLCSAIAGDMRSGSAKMTSNPIVTAPSAVMRVIKSAIVVRGHGHCPMVLRLPSSISTITTGRDVCSRGRNT